jgi:hypothetical protein
VRTGMLAAPKRVYTVSASWPGGLMGIVKCDTLKQAHFVFDQLATLRRVANLLSENRKSPPEKLGRFTLFL